MDEEDKRSKEKVDELFNKNIKIGLTPETVEGRIISVLYSRGKISSNVKLGFSDRALVKDLLYIYEKKNE